MATRIAFDESPALSHAPIGHAPIGESLAERYRVERASHRTEAGLVFDAIDRHTDQRVALEVATSLREPEAWAKWQRDAMVAQTLEGAHVLRVFDVGVLRNGVPYLARERTLSSLAMELEVRERLSIEQAVAWTLQIADAIAEAHAKGAAHGDLRADNVFVARGGDGVIVKVAWATAAKAEGAAREDSARDVAALGAILRLLATGHVGDSDVAPKLPDEIARAVARALTTAPSERALTVQEFARSIAPFGAPPPPRASLPQTSHPPSSMTPPTSPAPSSLRDAWFSRAPRASFGDLAPPKRGSRGTIFAVVSVALVAAVLGVSWMLFRSDRLPRWTGTAPPEDAVDTTETTGAPLEEAEEPAAAPASGPAVPVESLPDAPRVPER